MIKHHLVHFSNTACCKYPNQPAVLCLCVLTTCPQAGGTAGPTLAACPQWISSGDSPAQTCSAQDERKPNRASNTLRCKATHNHPQSGVYLVEGCQVVSGLDEEGLVDSRMVHVMGSCCHQTQKYVQRTQVLCQLQHSNVCSLHMTET